MTDLQIALDAITEVGKRLGGDIKDVRDAQVEQGKTLALVADKSHASPCAAQVEIIKELREQHITPLENTHQQLVGVARTIKLLAATMLGVIALFSAFIGWLEFIR